MSDYKIVYVFNGFKWLWRQILLSIITLRRFVKEKERIVVFYSPPRFQEHIDWLKPRCELHLVETPLNSPEFRATRVYYKNKFYGVPMKLHAYTVDSSILFHLDCDTVIKGNVLELFEGDYDLLVSQWLEEGDSIMRENCNKLGLPVWPLQMDGCLIFKNCTQLKFKPIYEKYLVMLLNGELLPHDPIHVGVHAFNLGINHLRRDGYKVIRMPRLYHNYESDAKYVRHLVHETFALDDENEFFSEKEHRLKEVGA